MNGDKHQMCLGDETQEKPVRFATGAGIMERGVGGKSACNRGIILMPSSSRHRGQDNLSACTLTALSSIPAGGNHNCNLQSEVVATSNHIV